MTVPEDKDSSSESTSPLSGTTLRVFRFLYREHRPLGVHEVQRGLRFSSVSSAHYHLRKLVHMGLVKEEEGKYIVDKILFENMIRIGRSLIPIQATFAAFFASTLIILLTLLRPTTIYGVYIFALIINIASLGIFAYQAYRTKSRNI